MFGYGSAGATEFAVVAFAIGKPAGFLNALLKYVLRMGLSPVVWQQRLQRVFRQLVSQQFCICAKFWHGQLIGCLDVKGLRIVFGKQPRHPKQQILDLSEGAG